MPTPTPPAPSGGSGSSSNQTVPVPVSSGRGSMQVSASVSGATAIVSDIDAAQLDSMMRIDGQANAVEIDFSGLGKTIETVVLPANALGGIAAAARDRGSGVSALTVKLSGGGISFDGAALSAVRAQAGSQLRLTIALAKASDLNARQRETAGSAPVYTLTLSSGGTAITGFPGGQVTVSLPYTLKAGEEPAGVVVYYLDDSGNIQKCETTYDVPTQTASFTTGHLSLYFAGYDETAVSDWENPFTDVAGDSWYYDAVRYISENDLMSGYGFAPNDSFSRAQLAQVLYNLEDRPAAADGAFTDVPAGAWYADAVNWASANGFVTGYGGGLFGPDDSITREQLAAALYRYAQPKGGGSIGDILPDFTDASDISDWAVEPMRWCVMNGILEGRGGNILDPKGYSTRAEAAAILMRFCESVDVL